MQAQARLTGFQWNGYSPEERTKLFTLAKIMAAAVMTAGTISLLAWLAGAASFLRLVPASPIINPATALMLVAAGAGLWRVAWPPQRRDPIALALGVFVGIAGALKIADYLFGFGFHPDHLLFFEELRGRGAYPPVDMAPNTSVALLLGAVALILIPFEKHRIVLTRQILSLVLGFIALVALIGYSYHVLLFYRLGTASPMPLEAAVCFALLAFGLLAARPRQGLMVVLTSQTTGGAIARRLLPMAVAVPWIVGAVLLAGEQEGYWAREFGVAIFAVASIVIFTALIGWNAKLLFDADLEQRKNALRLAAQHHSTRVLAEAVNVRAAIPELLRVIGEGLDWNVGAFWTRDPAAHKLHCTDLWRSSRNGFGDFVGFCRGVSIAKGEDLPGQVWARAQPVWLDDLHQHPLSGRVLLAGQSGLQAACAFPVWVGQELFGVLEFFSSKLGTGDQSLIEMLSAVSTQAGLFVERAQAEEQVRQTSANLQRSNTDLQQFAYVASHDLFEPLRMVTSYLQLLHQRYEAKLDAQGREFIALALDGAQRMDALIRDLLEYSRVDIRGRSLEPTECEAALKAALSNLKVAIEESGATIDHGPLPRVRGDRIQLTQLFQNLVGNAIKFRGTQPPQVEVTAAEAQGEWRFRIKDNGIGIDPKHFDRIFVLFQRLHTRQEYAGTGMGLAICKKIVERHGGRIWVESKPGEGASFCFTLPAG